MGGATLLYAKSRDMHKGNFVVSEILLIQNWPFMLKFLTWMEQISQRLHTESNLFYKNDETSSLSTLMLRGNL